VTPTLQDGFGRPLGSLRLSVTDRCNLRCAYCMPAEEYVWLPKRDLLTFEELGTLVDVFTRFGVHRLRLTGGEPLLRRDVDELIAILAAKPAIEDLALTTNGLLLAERAAKLRAAGLHRVTVSLDTLQRDRFERLTRRDGLNDVLAGIDAARAAGFERLKLDTVVTRGVNDDELVPLLEYGRSIGAEVRFIEYMDVGGALDWSDRDVVSAKEMLARLGEHYGGVEPIHETSRAPARRYRLPDGTTFGVIASTTAPFCRSCDRSRLTADGLWFLCLYAPNGLDLRTPLRDGASADELAAILRSTWTARRDRGAEERLAAKERGPSQALRELRDDPHLEMHTRGG